MTTNLQKLLADTILLEFILVTDVEGMVLPMLHGEFPPLGEGVVTDNLKIYSRTAACG